MLPIVAAAVTGGAVALGASAACRFQQANEGRLQTHFLETEQTAPENATKGAEEEREEVDEQEEFTVEDKAVETDPIDPRDIPEIADMQKRAERYRRRAKEAESKFGESEELIMKLKLALEKQTSMLDEKVGKVTELEAQAELLNAKVAYLEGGQSEQVRSAEQLKTQYQLVINVLEAKVEASLMLIAEKDRQVRTLEERCKTYEHQQEAMQSVSVLERVRQVEAKARAADRSANGGNVSPKGHYDADMYNRSTVMAHDTGSYTGEVDLVRAESMLSVASSSKTDDTTTSGNVLRVGKRDRLRRMFRGKKDKGRDGEDV